MNFRSRVVVLVKLLLSMVISTMDMDSIGLHSPMKPIAFGCSCTPLSSAAMHLRKPDICIICRERFKVKNLLHRHKTVTL